ncbi:hypothetical protein [Staphylococcus equorum]|uniref:hypothetical protein n=1 Tax=Staphylococcus equorum TaxID=246432 RepID=UPI003FD86AB5
MKKRIASIISLMGLLLILSACGNTNQNKMQGEWEADNDISKNYIGEKMKISDDEVKVSGKGVEGTDIKHLNFKDKDDDESKTVRFYTKTPNEDDFDEQETVLEGDVRFEDNDKKMIIDGGMGMTFKFTKA